MTHICVSKVTIIVSDNGLSHGRRQAIIWNNSRIFLIGTLGTNFSEILIEILTFSFKKMRLKVSSAKRQPFSLGLNVLMIFLLRHSHLTLLEVTPQHTCIWMEGWVDKQTGTSYVSTKFMCVVRVYILLETYVIYNSYFGTVNLYTWITLYKWIY